MEDRLIDVEDAVENLFDVSLVKHYDSTSEDTFEECLMCGDWEGHKEGCPIPPLKKWMKMLEAGATVKR
jgi:hypothetical protein